MRPLSALFVVGVLLNAGCSDSGPEPEPIDEALGTSVATSVQRSQTSPDDRARSDDYTETPPPQRQRRPPARRRQPRTAAAETTVATSEPQASTTDPSAIDFDPIYAEAFAGFEAGWNAQRDAYQDPTNPVDFSQYYTGEALPQVADQLRQVADEGWVVRPTDEVQRIEFLGGVGGGSDVAIIQICQVLTESVVEAESGEVVYEGNDASIIEATVVLEEGVWKVQSQPRLADRSDSTDCEDL